MTAQLESRHDPATGQFLTRDPIEAVTRSAYRYVDGNPQNDVDPDGLGFCLFGQEHGGDSGCRGTNAATDLKIAGAALGGTALVVGTAGLAIPSLTTYTYDSRGNRTSFDLPAAPVTALTYDQANRLTTFGSTASYAYNGDGLRMAKTVSGVTTGFAWDVASELPLLLLDGTTAYVYWPGGLPLEQVSGATVRYYHHDQLGSTRAITSSAGAVVATSTFDAYGRLTGSSGSVPNPFGYAGQYSDAESGFQYLRARYYDPATAQFLTRDPLEAITRSPYAYVYGSPLNGTDPSGLFGIPEWVPVVGGKCVDIADPNCDSPGIGSAVPDCLAWQEDCESIVSQASDGSVCSSRYDEGCQAIKDAHSWTWNVSVSLLVAPLETSLATAIGGPAVAGACLGGWIAYGIEGTWSAKYNDDPFTKTGMESWKHGMAEGATYSAWALGIGKLKALFR